MATHVTKEPVTLDGYQAILKPSEYGHTLTALLPKEIVDALEDERVGGLEWAKSKAKNPRRVTIKPEPGRGERRYVPMQVPMEGGRQGCTCYRGH